MAETDLGKFEGAPVVMTTVAVTKAGDGLSDALGIDPMVIKRGWRGRVVMDVVADSVTFTPVDKNQRDNPKAALARKVTLAAETVSVLQVGESAHVDQVLADQRERVAAAREAERLEETGEERIPGTHEAAGVPPSHLTPVPD